MHAITTHQLGVKNLFLVVLVFKIFCCWLFEYHEGAVKNMLSCSTNFCQIFNYRKHLFLRASDVIVLFDNLHISSVVKICTTIFIFFLVGTWRTFSLKRLRWRRCGEFCCVVGESHTCQFGEVF